MRYLQVIAVLALFTFSQCSSPKNATTNTAVQQMINSKNYTFVAQYAEPLGGRQITLTSEYTLTIRNDSLISYLPYYGQAYVAPMNPQDAGMNFTSTSFDYVSNPAKKGGFTIIIKPRNEPKASQMILNVSSAGYAGLQVLSTNRQAISFRGVVRKNG